MLQYTELAENKSRFYAMLAAKLQGAQLRVQMVALKRIQAEGSVNDAMRSLSSTIKCLKKIR